MNLFSNEPSTGSWFNDFADQVFSTVGAITFVAARPLNTQIVPNSTEDTMSTRELNRLDGDEAKKWLEFVASISPDNIVDATCTEAKPIEPETKAVDGKGIKTGGISAN